MARGPGGASGRRPRLPLRAPPSPPWTTQLVLYVMVGVDGVECPRDVGLVVPGHLSTILSYTSSLHHFITSSLRHFITSSLHHFITSSLHHFITSSLHFITVTSSLCHFVTSSLHHFITSSLSSPPLILLFLHLCSRDTDLRDRPRHGTSVARPLPLVWFRFVVAWCRLVSLGVAWCRLASLGVAWRCLASLGVLVSLGVQTPN
jgi:hypothetical protein